MNIKEFNEIIGIISHKYISRELHDNSAIYHGIINNAKITIKFENLGLDRYIVKDGKTYYNMKLNDIIKVVGGV